MILQLIGFVDFFLILIGFSVYIDTEAGEVEVGAIPTALVVIVAVIGTVAAAAVAAVVVV